MQRLKKRVDYDCRKLSIIDIKTSHDFVCKCLEFCGASCVDLDRCLVKKMRPNFNSQTAEHAFQEFTKSADSALFAEFEDMATC